MDEKEAFREEYKYYLTRVKKAKTILRELKKHTQLDTEKKLKVLAVGGEFGFIEYNLAKWTKWDITTSDVVNEHITRFPLVQEKVAVKILDATKLKEKEKYDLVIFNHVIEHIPKYQTAVDNLYKALKKGGYLYLATPNLYRLFVTPKILLRSKNVDNKTRIRYHMGFSTPELLDIFKKYNLVVNLNKDHLVHNLGMLGSVASMLPQSFFDRYSQTNVMIFRK